MLHISLSILLILILIFVIYAYLTDIHFIIYYDKFLNPADMHYVRDPSEYTNTIINPFLEPKYEQHKESLKLSNNETFHNAKYNDGNGMMRSSYFDTYYSNPDPIIFKQYYRDNGHLNIPDHRTGSGAMSLSTSHMF